MAVIVGCTTTKIDETPPGSGVYTTNVVIDPKLETALTTIGAVNEATKPVNPFSGLITIGLAAITAGASWFAKRKNDQLLASTGQLKAVIQGVEIANATGVKEAIKAQAIVLGAEELLNSTVQKVNNGQL